MVGAFCCGVGVEAVWLEPPPQATPAVSMEPRMAATRLRRKRRIGSWLLDAAQTAGVASATRPLKLAAHRAYSFPRTMRCMRSLEISVEEFRQLADRVTDLACDYLGTLDQRRIMP